MNAVTSDGSDDDEDGSEHTNEAGSVVLRGLNLSVLDGELVLVLGPVGSGKSTLVAALLGLVSPTEPTRRDSLSQRHGVFLRDTWGHLQPAAAAVLGHPHQLRAAFSSQRPWIQNASLRDNVVFGLPFDKKTYEQVLACCALNRDVDSMEEGDATCLGEEGVRCSGGQQQRVGLARAVYAALCPLPSDGEFTDGAFTDPSRSPPEGPREERQTPGWYCDLVVLDDVLSAVDAHVGNHIWQQCITGVLGSRGNQGGGVTRFMVTHNTRLINSPHVDQVVALNAEGTVAYAGSAQRLRDDPTLGPAWVTSVGERGNGKESGEKEDVKEDYDEEEEQDDCDEKDSEPVPPHATRPSSSLLRQSEHRRSAENSESQSIPSERDEGKGTARNSSVETKEEETKKSETMKGQGGNVGDFGGVTEQHETGTISMLVLRRYLSRETLG